VVAKDWFGGDAQPVIQQPYQPQVQQPYQQPAYTQPVAQPQVRDKHQYGFFDIMLGFGGQNINMKFTNNSYSEKFSDLGISYVPDGPYSSIEFQDLVGRGAGPIGFRVGRFGKGAIGVDLEFSISKHAFDRQTVNMKAGSGTGKVSFDKDDYLNVTSFGLSSDLLIRVTNEKVDPYFGIGLGMSLNKIQLPYVKGYTESSTFSAPTDDFGIGLMFRIPIGIRVKFNPKTHFYAELRYELNSMYFDRNMDKEEDTILTSGARFVTGLGFAF
jgi:hypothetical protein